MTDDNNDDDYDDNDDDEGMHVKNQPMIENAITNDETELPKGRHTEYVMKRLKLSATPSRGHCHAPIRSSRFTSW